LVGEATILGREIRPLPEGMKYLVDESIFLAKFDQRLEGDPSGVGDPRFLVGSFATVNLFHGAGIIAPVVLK